MDAGCSSDDDYMSDKFLESIPNGPGPTSNKTKRTNESRVPSQKVTKGKKMDVEREEGLKRRIGEDNIGYKLMLKMGFKSNCGIGKNSQGRVDPIPIEIIDGRKGFGLNNLEKKRNATLAAAKRQRDMVMSAFQSDFRTLMASRFRNERTKHQLTTARSICRRLDLAKSIKQPVNREFWPPDETKAKLPAHSEMICRETRQPKTRHSQRKRRNMAMDSVAESVLENADESHDRSDLPLDSVSDEEEYCDLDLAQCNPSEPHPDMILTRLSDYLRESHLYCFWCGIQYSNSIDLETNCPGSTEEDHG